MSPCSLAVVYSVYTSFLRILANDADHDQTVPLVFY